MGYDINIIIPPPYGLPPSRRRRSGGLAILVLGMLLVCGAGMLFLVLFGGSMLASTPAIAQGGSIIPVSRSSQADEARRQVVNFAYDQLGKSYVWGGNGPDVWDCSGLVKAAYASVGITIPRTCTDQWFNIPSLVPGARILDPDEPKKAGDLIFFTKDGGKSSHHIGIMDGLRIGSFIEATPPRVTRSDLTLKDDAEGIKGRADLAGSLLLGYIRVISDDYQGDSEDVQPVDQPVDQPPPQPPPGG